MRYKKFKNAEIEVSQLAVGTWAIGGQNYGKVDKNEAICAIRRMIENGVNLIDTAPCYGNGTSEKIVGEVLKEIPREQVLISTKFGLIPDIYTHGYKKDTSYKNAMREIQSSLMNLETDYIDFYFVHWPDVNTPIDETMAALEEMKRKGYIRYVGVSNFTAEQIKEAEQYIQIDVQQPLYSMVDRGFEDLMSWGYDRGIDNTNYYTKVEDAVRFVEQTGCDSLAIAVGNAHGPYVKTPNLDLERIYAIRKKVNIPLVLHGCSDIPEEQIKEAVNLGMSKFNIATEYFRTMYQSIEKRINNQEFEGNGVKLMYDIREEMIDFVIQKIRLLNPNKYSM